MSNEAQAKLKRILDLAETEIGEGRPEVNDDPLGELIATALSQNTTDTNSRRAYASLRSRFPKWSDARDASHEEIADAIRMSGLAETKARTIKEILTTIETLDGEPSLEFVRDLSNDEAIQRLSQFKGVGVKTAACVLLFALGRDICPVDTHVHRVANRLGLVRTRGRDATFIRLTPLIPKGGAARTHVLLIRFGRRICKARRPLCHACPAFNECAYEDRHEIAASHVGGGDR